MDDSDTIFDGVDCSQLYRTHTSGGDGDNIRFVHIKMAKSI